MKVAPDVSHLAASNELSLKLSVRVWSLSLAALGEGLRLTELETELDTEVEGLLETEVEGETLELGDSETLLETDVEALLDTLVLGLTEDETELETEVLGLVDTELETDDDGEFIYKASILVS